MHFITQHFSERIVEDMREGVVGQDALPPLLISVTHHFVPHCKPPLSPPHMQHIPRCDLHARTGKYSHMHSLTAGLGQ